MTWREELKQGLSEVEDQRTPVEEHPLYPLIVAALEEVRQELSTYGIWTVLLGSHNGRGASIGIWTPDIYELRIIILAGDQTISASATHSKFRGGLFPFAQREINVAGITKDVISSEIVEMYLTYLRTPPDAPRVTPTWPLRTRDRRRKARRS